MSWRRFLQRDRWDRERAMEIDAYLEAETAENVARGMAPAEAAAAARRKFGNPLQIREEIYRMNSVSWFDQTWQDLRYAARVLRLSPGFAIVAMLSLALGIGANTAIFQLIDSVRLQSLPVPHPEELAEVRIVGGNRGMGVSDGRYSQLTMPAWQAVEARQQGFSSMFAWGQDGLRVGRGSETRPANGIVVTGAFFKTLEVYPWRGRLLTKEDEYGPCPAGAGHAVVSYGYWQSEMGGREPSPETKLEIYGQSYEVVGVTPPGFLGVAVGEDFDIALPFCQPKEFRRDHFNVAVMGRLRSGWTLAQASDQLDSVSPGIFADTTPSGYDSDWITKFLKFRLAAYPGASGVSWLRQAYDSSLWLLLSITGLVLLIACANLANLMLARASVRQQEIAVRLAIGASRGRIVRQLLSESVLLTTVGAAMGIALAWILSRLLVRSLSTNSDTVHLPISVDWRVLLFAAAVAGLTCAVFGFVPALRATRTEPMAAMSGGRTVTGRRERFSLQRVLVVSQIAVSLVLLGGAFLFVRSFYNLAVFDPGMRKDGISIVFLGFQESRLPEQRFADFTRELVEEARTTPGILHAANTTNVPLLGASWTHVVEIEGKKGDSKFTWVSPSYFETMGIPILSGRRLEPTDTAASTRVAVVNETFVRRYLGGANPIGRTMRTLAEPDYPSTVYEIVGVIPDTRYADLRQETPAMTFAPDVQCPRQRPWTTIMVHSGLPPAAAGAAVARRIAERHPEIITDTIDFHGRIKDGLVRERLMAVLSGFFGILAAVLAIAGMYGVISYIVARRRKEIGIRVALGARRLQVVGLIMREAGILLALGIVVGTGFALAGGRAATSLLFGLKPYDPMTLGGAAALLAIVTCLAAYVPSRRASRLDPMETLRCE
jgi:putative ABC transport system permease protein